MTLTSEVSGFEWSRYQKDFYREVEQGNGDLMLRAAAGAGKTSTLIEGARYVLGLKPLFVAFSRRDVDEFKKRLGWQAKVISTYGLGYRAIRKHLGINLELDQRGDKYHKLVGQATRQLMGNANKEVFSDAVRQMKELLKFCQVTLTDPSDPDAFEEMIQHFDLQLPHGQHAPIVADYLSEVLKEGAAIARDQGLVTYTDQVYLPHLWNLTPETSEIVFGDELQDTSRAQLSLILKARQKGGRLLMCADPRQAVYGFSGAASDAYDRILEETRAKVMPLPVCYRCSAEVVKHAKQYVPELEVAPNAPQGSVSRIKRGQLEGVLLAGDMILCRVTAPLINLCLSLIARKIPARIKGRDIGKTLANTVKLIDGLFPGANIKDFGRLVQMWANSQIEMLMGTPGSEAKIESIRDRAAALNECWTGFNPQSIEGLCASIENLFEDESATIWLSTVHKAKGGEWPRVFVLHPEKLPLVWKNQREWERQQEENLRYVCYTRAQRDLIFVE